jgi:hypothetical protein
MDARRPTVFNNLESRWDVWARNPWELITSVTLYRALQFQAYGYLVERSVYDPSGSIPLFPRMVTSETPEPDGRVD